MSMDEPLRPLLQSLRVGVAAVEPDSLEILFENGAFFGWFKPVGEEVEPLPVRMPMLDRARAQARLDQGRPYRFETDIRNGARTSSLVVELRPENFDGRQLIVVEVQDVSKQKEAEYMLDSYSKLAEKHAR